MGKVKYRMCNKCLRKGVPSHTKKWGSVGRKCRYCGRLQGV